MSIVIDGTLHVWNRLLTDADADLYRARPELCDCLNCGPTRIARTCRKAIELLKERGWHQGYYVASLDINIDLKDLMRGAGRAICLIGALNIAEGRRPEQDPSGHWEQWDVAQAVSNAAGVFPSELADWNDHEARTLDQVIGVLEKAADGQ